MDTLEALMARLTRERGRAGEIAAQHLATGGKRLRARLALDALAGLGGTRAAGVAWAAACELLHNATLIHDDLQDGDRTRRGAPTAWTRHGAAQALNAGDLLLMLPFLALENLPASAELRWCLASTLARHAASTVRGQSDELALEPTCRWDAYRTATVGKTCALFLLPVEGAALLAGRDPECARRLATGFEHLGVLFQLQDDVLDLYGEKGREAPGSDLREGKISALVVEHLRLHPYDVQWLREVLALPRDATPAAQVKEAIARFRRDGALTAVMERIDVEVRATRAHPVLRSEPELRAIALALTRVALAPIEHLRETGKRARRATVTAG